MPVLRMRLIPHPLVAGVPPDWASQWGEDEGGPFAAFEVGHVVVRMRWIPPGQFLMGSPDDEEGRWDHEGPQQLVTVPRGFWMFETPCTQELWQEVMSDNPSRFVSPKRPVEHVSWNDCQTFMEQISHRVAGLSLQMPTEAEWEYACRAGTTTATYRGDLEILGLNNAPVLDDIAWYGGNCGVNFDLEDGVSTGWKEKQHEFETGATRLVRLKLPNRWGLYDMLGNVWEWCADRWRDRYDVEPMSASRVIRGGSWSSTARDARAACRGRFTPGSRNYDLGFRCVEFGAELQSGRA